MLAIFLSFLVSFTLCELPPAGYVFPLLSQKVGTAFDAKFLRESTSEVYTITGKTVVITMDPGLSAADFPAVPAKTSDIVAEFGLALDAIDTAFVRSTGHLYIFAGSLVWRFSDPVTKQATAGKYQLDAAYPQKIANEFYGLPDNLVASVELPNNHIYFFKNDDYYLIRDAAIYRAYPSGGDTINSRSLDRVEACYPKKVNTQFELPAGMVLNAYYSPSLRNIQFSVVNGAVVTDAVVADKYNLHYFSEMASAPQVNPEVKLCVSALPIPIGSELPLKYDAVFQRKTGKIYIFSGDQYWRLTDKNYNPQPNDCLDAGYPKKIANHFVLPSGAPGGVPTPITAVFQRDNGKIYFFVGSDYYRFTDKYIDESADPTKPDVLDEDPANPGVPYYPQPLSNFGITPTQYNNRKVIGVFQRPNGKLFIFLQELTTGEITHFRITDKYITGVEHDVVDPMWAASANGLPLSPAFKGLTPPFDVVYQRTESNQQIYFHTGNRFQTAFDKYIHLPTVCTACDPTSDGQ